MKLPRSPNQTARQLHLFYLLGKPNGWITLTVPLISPLMIFETHDDLQIRLLCRKFPKIQRGNRTVR